MTQAIKKGLPIIQGDADNDLKHYPSNAVDYVILSQTLQVTKYPVLVLEELKRISKYCIISVPNFGYYENRLNFLLKGRMPVTKTLSYEWYDTPNIHFCTIKDFIILCKSLGFIIEKQFFINDSSIFCKKITSDFIGNFCSKYGIFLLKRGITADTTKPELHEKIYSMNLNNSKNYAKTTN